LVGLLALIDTWVVFRYYLYLLSLYLSLLSCNISSDNHHYADLVLVLGKF